MTSRLSTRISLRWPPEPAFENTDTLVLSVGNWYVDLRVDTGTGEIDWAIAGERLQDEKSNEVLFTHELDSRNSFGVADCGSFSELPNGDELELGVMPRPDLPGAPMSEYEEIWRKLPFQQMEDSKQLSFALESSTDGMELNEGEEKAVTRTFIGAIWGTYIALRQVQVVVRRAGETKVQVMGGVDVSARREDFVQGEGFQVKYSLGPDAGKFPSRDDIQFPLDGSRPKSLMVCGQEYIVRALEITDIANGPIEGSAT